MKTKKTQIAQLIQNAEFSKEQQTASIAVGSGSTSSTANSTARGIASIAIPSATRPEQNEAQGHSPECSSSTALGSGSIAGGSKNVAIGKTTPGVSIGLSWN